MRRAYEISLELGVRQSQRCADAEMRHIESIRLEIGNNSKDLDYIQFFIGSHTMR